MAHVISCHACGQKSSVSEAIFEKRIAGKKVTLRCTQCREAIPVDGTTPGELRVIPPARPAKASSPPVKASPPPLARARVTADYGRLVLTPQPQAAAPRTPVPRDEMVTLDDTSADETTRIAAIPPASATPPASSPPVAPTGMLEAALAPIATPPPSSATSSAPAVPTAPTPELELTPPAVACAVEPPPPASTAALVRDEIASSRDKTAPRQKGRSVARAALLSAIPLVAAAALAVGVLEARRAIPGEGKWKPVAASALPAVLKAPAAKFEAPPASAPVSAPVAIPVPAPELAPSPAPVLAEDEASQTPPEALAIPSYVKAPVVLHRTQLALRSAERCHPSGHAVGTARVYVTFAPNGRVVDARLEGEPLAGAPVARCLLDHARSIRLPRFKGEPFTIQQEITLR